MPVVKYTDRVDCETHEIDLGYSADAWATEEEQDRAAKILSDLFDDPDYAISGRRNDDAVNTCIASYVLDIPDPVEFIKKMCLEQIKMDGYSYAKFEEHVKRVVPYLDKWGADAFMYLV